MDAILGYIVALTLSMIGVAGFTTWAKLGVANVQTAATAGQMMTFDKAAQQYVQDNGTTIAALATATSPVTVTPAMLIAAGYLPNGFSPNNVFGQTWQLQVLQPAAGQLQSLVTSQGGTPISNTRQLVQIAAQAGAQGGFVPYVNQAGDASMTPANANGAYGAWKLPLANYTNPGSGHLASLLAFTNVQSNNAYLYRVAVGGHPELNTMQTALNMGTNDIDNAATINSNTVNSATVNATNVNAQGVNVQNGDGTPTVTVGNASIVNQSGLQQIYLQGDRGTVVTNANASNYATLYASYLQPYGHAVAGTSCPSDGMIGNSGTEPLFCRLAVWTQMNSGGAYVNSMVVTGDTGWIPNNSSRTQLVVAFGGNGGNNDCDLAGSVSGVGGVAEQRDNNPDWAKTCTIMFPVPPGTAWWVTSTPWGSPPGTIIAHVYQE